MRSRYVAYVRGERDYLLNTWHASSRPEHLDLSEQPDWQRLEIVACVAGQPGDLQGEVEFAAHYRGPLGPACLRERSRFVYEQGHWFYLDGRSAKTRSDKIGRNAPCPCGSGKKYKQCCGR